MKLVTTKFKSGGLHEKHVVANWNVWEPSQHLLIDTGKPREIVGGYRRFGKTCFIHFRSVGLRQHNQMVSVFRTTQCE